MDPAMYSRESLRPWEERGASRVCCADARISEPQPPEMSSLEGVCQGPKWTRKVVCGVKSCRYQQERHSISCIRMFVTRNENFKQRKVHVKCGITFVVGRHTKMVLHGMCSCIHVFSADCKWMHFFFNKFFCIIYSWMFQILYKDTEERSKCCKTEIKVYTNDVKNYDKWETFRDLD